MSKKEVHAATHFVDLPEEELKAFLLNRYEGLKLLDEAQKNDGKLKKLTEDLKEYKDTVYTYTKKEYRAEIKAARAVAKARGIEFKLPKEAFNDD